MINRHAERNKQVRAERLRAYREQVAAFDEALRSPQQATPLVSEQPPAPPSPQDIESPAPAPAAHSPVEIVETYVPGPDGLERAKSKRAKR